MVKIGNTTLPGVQTTVESSRSVGVGVGSPGDILLIGPSNEEGEAEPNTAYQVRTPSRSRHYFGEDSPLSDAIIDALREGAFPVYAISTEAVDVEDEGVTSDSGTVEHVPVSEDPSDTTFSVDGSDLTTVTTFEDPSEQTPGTAEAILNPVTGDYHIDYDGIDPAAVDYVHQDYESAVQSIGSEIGNDVDLVGVLVETESVVDVLVDEVNDMASNYNFAIAVAGASPYLGDNIDSYMNDYDTSRLQFVYPSRNTDGESIIGSYLGVRSAIGISASPMRKRISSQTSLNQTLSSDEKAALLAERVNPLGNERAGARIIDDVTSVTDDNANERNMKQGISRLVIDFVTIVVNANSDDFIGELHTDSARNSLQNIIKSELKDLVTLNAIRAYSVSVQEVDSMTASVDVGVETVDPLRNIVATVTAGEVESAL